MGQTQNQNNIFDQSHQPPKIKLTNQGRTRSETMQQAQRAGKHGQKRYDELRFYFPLSDNETRDFYLYLLLVDNKHSARF